MKRKLSRIHTRWRRIAISTVLNILLLISRLNLSPRARYHWVGGPRKSRRLERPIFGMLFACAIALLEPHDFIYWCVLAGGCAALFLNMHTIYQLIPVKQRHWIRPNDSRTRSL